MLLFVDQVTERLIYTLDFVFRKRGVNYRLTNDWLEFSRSKDTKWLYSDYPNEEYLSIVPSSLLFDEGIFNYGIQSKDWNGVNCLAIDQIVDPLASVFYVLSRYEEYVPFKVDLHDRFAASESIMFKNHWVELCICDRWAHQLLNWIEKELKTDLKRSNPETKLIPTVDIDNTFAFQWKEGVRGKLSAYKDRWKKDQLRIAARKSFEEGQAPDPYDAYEYLGNIVQRGYDLHLFWLLGQYSGHDRNISPHDVRHQELIRSMSRLCTVGIHPSYASNTNSALLEQEMKLLKQISGLEVEHSRQHYLKLRFPLSYRKLLAAGIKHDYTMGFADRVGFRAGTAQAHYFFDLVKNEVTDLLIHPFAYMDGTLLEYLKLDPQSAQHLIQRLWEEVKTFGGDFIFIWHNETLTDFGKWNGWKEVFEFTLSLGDE